MPKRICLMGATTEVGNRGVAALAASLTSLISDLEPETQITFLLPSQSKKPLPFRIQGRERLVPVVNHRLSPRAPLNEQLAWILALAFFFRTLPVPFLRRKILRMNPWIREVLAADFVADIRGGDSFSDIYGWRRLILGSLPLVAVAWLKGGFVLLPQTYGPFKGVFARFFARFILNRADAIFSRDKSSLEIVSTLTKGRARAHFCPDVAFALDSHLPEKLTFDPILPAEARGTLVGINVNGLMYNGGYTRANMFGLKLDYREFLVQAIAALSRFPDVRILLIPHTFALPGSVESDPEACELVRNRLPQELGSRVHVLTGAYDQYDIKGIIGSCDFFIGSRMHACIAALSQGIPAVGVAYSKKFAGVFESVGAQDWIIDGRDLGTDQAVAETVFLFKKRAELKSELKMSIAKAQAQLKDIFSKLIRSPEHVGKSAAEKCGKDFQSYPASSPPVESVL